MIVFVLSCSRGKRYRRIIMCGGALADENGCGWFYRHIHGVIEFVRDTVYRALQAREALLGGKQTEPTVEEIAEEIGISQAQVSRLENAALERMRKQI